MTWQPPKPRSEFEAVGVYIFAGGFTIGMAEEFNVRGHLEDGPFGVATFKANFPRIPVWTNPAKWPVEKFRGVDIVYGNPPCAPWSPVGRSMRHGAENWRTDPNVECARKLIEYGLKTQPTIWVMESVPQIQRSEFLLDMAQIWLDAGYAFTLVREDAKFFGLPQQRRRCFMVAHKVAIPWTIEGMVVDNFITAGECLETVTDPGTYPEIPEQHRHLVLGLPGGGSLRDAWEQENPQHRGADGRDIPVKGRPLLMIHRLDPTTVSGVIIGMNVYIHPFEDRFIGYKEAAKLCGYPEGYVWVNGARGRGDDRAAQVAKAVTPPAARFLAANLRAGLEANVPAEVKAQRYTAWASSTRVTSFQMYNHLEDWDIRHACTAVVEPEPSPVEVPIVMKDSAGVDWEQPPLFNHVADGNSGDVQYLEWDSSFAVADEGLTAAVEGGA